MLVNDNGCPFCNEFNGRKELSYFEIMIGSQYGIIERKILETDNFVCVPSIGSFVEGYVLVIPKQHFLSTLIMPECRVEELNRIIYALSRFYSDYYHKKILIYEHGTADSCNIGGMSVVHAHLHVVPCSEQVISKMCEYNFLRFNDLFDAQAYYLNNSKYPYLLLKDVDDKFYMAVNDVIPSQYFRNKVCDLCGIKGTGDWKKYPYIENIKRTLASAKEYGLTKIKCDCEG